MANPAAAIRAAVQAAHPGATVVERGRNVLRHQIGNRTIVDAESGPLHISGTETEIDTAWLADTGVWQWKMEQADYSAHARSVFNVGNILEYRDRATGEWVIFDPQSLNWINQDNSRQQIAIKQAITGQVTGDVMGFPAAWGAGRHFRYQLETGRLQKLITIDSAANLPAATVQGPTIWLEAEFSLSHSAGVALYLDGVLWAKQNNVRVRTASRVEFRDAATGQTVLWFLDFPRAWDSSTPLKSTIGQIEVRRQGGASNLFITVRIPKTWIDQAIFPIFIDPTIDKTVAGNYDDSIESASGDGSAPLNDDYYQMKLPGGSGNQRWAAARFTGITIDAGSTIDVSYLSWREGDQGIFELNVRITGEDVASPVDYNGGFLYNRTPTTNTVTWDAALTEGAYNNSPSINTIVSELLASYTYSNAVMAFILESLSTVDGCYLSGYTRGAAYAPKLHIEYTAGGAAPVWPLPGRIMLQAVNRAATY